VCLVALHVAALISEAVSEGTASEPVFQAYTVRAAMVTPNGVSATVAAGAGSRQPDWSIALQVVVSIIETVVPPLPMFPLDPPGPSLGTYSVCVAWSTAEMFGPLPTRATAGRRAQPTVRRALHLLVLIIETVPE
jgi:hypothetical protein